MGATSDFVNQRVRQPCAQARSAPDPKVLAIISELRGVIRESLLDAENLAAARFLQHQTVLRV
jgi:hypothetical protein